MTRIARLILTFAAMLALIAFVLVAASRVHGPDADVQSARRAAELPQEPDPSLSAEQVVHVQLLALRHDGGTGHGVARCFAFASPANRQITGPLPRFAAMVESPPYDLMSRFDEVKVDQVLIDQELAEVAVTLSTTTGETVGFIFFLRRQTDDPYKDCWMTEGVRPVIQEHAAPADVI